jgi:tRNA pseudouridine32 synthase/23S rRNA pseudouridine746 synthase/23S rRNA pseudouridine1911/1915/1917 synthase
MNHPARHRKRHHDRLKGIRLLYEDEDLIVLEKPAGLLTQTLRDPRIPSVESVLTDYVRKGQWKSSKCVYLVHRLDRATSGVMLVAKTESVQNAFRNNWNNVTEKTYLARVEGRLDAEHGRLESRLVEDSDYHVHSTNDPTAGKLAITVWTRLAEITVNGRTETVVAATLHTGRKNQIRVQFADAGHPVVGDAKYGHAAARDALCLHAWRLAFIHPRTHRRLAFETARPAFSLSAPDGTPPAAESGSAGR